MCKTAKLIYEGLQVPLLGTGQNLWENGAGKFGTGSCLIFRPGSNGVIRDFEILHTGSSLISMSLDNGVICHFQNCRTGLLLISRSLDDGVVRHFKICSTGSLLISMCLEDWVVAKPHDELF